MAGVLHFYIFLGLSPRPRYTFVCFAILLYLLAVPDFSLLRAAGCGDVYKRLSDSRRNFTADSQSNPEIPDLLAAGSYRLSDQKTLQDLSAKFVPAISFTNEENTWNVLRDKMLVEAINQPDRYVVTTGLQQSLEMAFSGAYGVVIVDAHGPTISAFMQLADLASKHETREAFFSEARKILSLEIPSSTDVISSYAVEGDSVEKFLQIFEAYGASGYQRFRDAALSDRLRAVHENVANKNWGERVRLLTEGKAPAAVYLSNILNHLDPSAHLNLSESLYLLSVDRRKSRNWIGRSRSRIVYGSLMALTSFSSVEAGFTYSVYRPWEMSIPDLRVWVGRQPHPEASELQLKQSVVSPLTGEYVQIKNHLTGETLEGLLSVGLGSFIRLNQWDGRERKVFFHPDLYEIKVLSSAPPLAEEMRQLSGRQLSIKSTRSDRQYDLVFMDLLSIMIENGEVFALFRVKDPKTGELSQFQFNSQHHRVLP